MSINASHDRPSAAHRYSFTLSPQKKIMLTPNPHLSPLTPYTPPPQGRLTTTDLLLDANECTEGPPPAVIAALVDALRNPRTIRCYPEYGFLTQELARYAAVSPCCLLPTNGSDQAIDLIFRCYASPGDEAVIPAPSFATFFQSAALQGCSVNSPLYDRERGFPCAEILNQITPRTRIIVICTPNNPTGTLAPINQILSIAAAAPHAAILVDECYFEFAGVTVARHICEYPNLFITRTLSKTWALAGVRIGYVIASEGAIAELNKIRGPYDVNALASIAAQAALADVAPMIRYATEVATRSRPLLCDFLTARRIPFWESAANFVLVHPPEPDQLTAHLNAAGIRVRPRSGPNIEGTIRISLGTYQETERLIAAMAAFLDAR